MSGKPAASIAVAAVALASAAGIASAAGGEKSEVDIVRAAGGFQGFVSAEHAPCEPRRVVKVVRDVIDRDPEVVGKDRTNRRGKWKLRLGSVEFGLYTAVVKRKRLGDDAGTVCKKASSETIDVR